jgi:hypothetical protein
MDFNPEHRHQIFGEDADEPASDVDLATVVYGYYDNGGDNGETAVFSDSSSWVVAVGVVDPDDSTNPPNLFNLEVPSYLQIRFLNEDGDAPELASTIVIDNPEGLPQQDENAMNMRMPKIDATYMGVDGQEDVINVVVVCRIGFDTFDWDTWDLVVYRLECRYYSGGSPHWQLGAIEEMTSNAMSNIGIGQSHPDIVYDQDTGDIYCAWTEFISLSQVEIYYQRHDEAAQAATWSGTALTLNQGNFDDHNGWYVNLDVGVVSCVPCDLDDERVVGYVYTGQFDQGSDEWGYRPMVGWWSIASGPDETDHAPRILLSLPGEEYHPETTQWPNAGLIKIDIAKDNADNAQGAAIVFVQEEGLASGDYEVYGGNSLDPDQYLYLSDIDNPVTYDSATHPSLAIHESGDTASVSYFGLNVQNPEWQAYAVHWFLDDNTLGDIASDISIDADGEFTLDIADLLHHNYGTASSLAVLDANGNNYWAGWSDSVHVSADPIEIWAAMGFADIT